MLAQQPGAGPVKRGKSFVKKQLKTLRRFTITTLWSFDARDLAAAMRKVGVAPGDSLLVHSSFDAFEGYTGKPSEIIATLQEAVGPRGNLLMPTLPFTGTAVAYAAAQPVFDVRRTPSRMGLVTEMFRRMPGVLRSVHPTHPVAIWGADAAALAADHHLSTTPCGHGSPFAKLHARKGKIVLLGTTIESLTFYHYIEEALESLLPENPFTQQEYSLRCVNGEGATVETRTRLFDPGMSRRRDLCKLVPELQRRGAWRTAAAGRLQVVALAADDVFSSVRDMASRKVYCYED